MIDSGQAFFQSAAGIEEFLMVKSQLVENRGMEIMHADRVFNDTVSEFISDAVGGSPFNASASHPGCKGLHVMVTT